MKDTLSSSPSENKVMRKAASVGISTAAMFYMLCGNLGYAAMGNAAPDNFLSASYRFYHPYWLMDLGNLCIAIRSIGACQVFAQPLFQFVETWSKSQWPDSRFVTAEYYIGIPKLGYFSFSFFRLAWRTSYIVSATVVAMILPFFDSLVGLSGAISYWFLTVYLPTEMYIRQTKVVNRSWSWWWLRILGLVTLLVSLAAACGSVQGII